MVDKSAEIIFRNACVIDGSGSPEFQADVAVNDDRITAIGALEDTRAGIEINATGRVLSPGFIDTHTHDDCALLANPQMEMKASQGVTTVVVGNCGVSLAPLVTDHIPAPLDLVRDHSWYRFHNFADYLGELDKEPPATNAVCLVGHMTLRVAHMQTTDRVATGREITAMRRSLNDALEAGAAGFSTGLEYDPNKHASTDEITQVAADLHKLGGVYTTHMRSEGEAIIEAIDESCHIGRTCGSPVVISHFKCYGTPNHGRSEEIIKHYETHAATLDVGFDVYPYAAASTILHAGEVDRVKRVVITASVPHPEKTGRDLHEIAAEWELTVDETIAKLQPAGATYYGMDEADVQRILAHPKAMIGSDGIPDDTLPHPRLWGTFPRVLGHYSRDLGLFPLTEAVRKMTALPAERFGLTDRGTVKVGNFADLVLFDPARVADVATYEDPKRPAAGIDLVMTNGRAVWRDGKTTGERAGRVLRNL